MSPEFLFEMTKKISGGTYWGRLCNTVSVLNARKL